ncbi:hypothetical protein [Bifidobacterium longum]|uniref:hypothetical protein n=1 Tax=Bifidobacterium longum TaxID=216816 RepID=UPI002025A88D|nr:hypothetical protein [Bifidobacterium longum]
MVTCSALKKIYRDKLRRQGVVFVYMQGTFDEVMERLERRISELQLELKQCEGQQGRTDRSSRATQTNQPSQSVQTNLTIRAGPHQSVQTDLTDQNGPSDQSEPSDRPVLVD